METITVELQKSGQTDYGFYIGERKIATVEPDHRFYKGKYTGCFLSGGCCCTNQSLEEAIAFISRSIKDFFNQFNISVNVKIDFEIINALQRQCINLCRGCEYDHCASCTDERLPICSEQYVKYSVAQFHATAHTSSEWRALCKISVVTYKD